jgi:PTH1 family peptidyl-tRNA hydrolase
LKVILGLGNPGAKYEATRHNVGWWVLDHLADVWRFDGWRKDGESLTATGAVGTHKVRLVKPQTYMNLSGAALKPFLRRPFWSAATDLLVVVDDVALPLGRYRLRAQGSAGGHNGLKSVQHALGNMIYARMRIGILPPDEAREAGDLADFVLGAFGKVERETIIELMPRFTDAAELWLRDGIERAMNVHNREG